MQLRISEEDRSLWEARESALEQKIQENNGQIMKLETYWIEAQELCKSVNEQLAKTQAQYETLDKKYNKAKKLIKDYQQKWVRGLGFHINDLVDTTSAHTTSTHLICPAVVRTNKEYLDKNPSNTV